MDSEDEEYFHWKKLTAKGKNKTPLSSISDVLELKLRTGRQGKCVGAAPSELLTVAKEPQSYTFISNEVWFHLANYIAPEDVKNYSLICSQSANSVRFRLFWLQIYSRYCQQERVPRNKWILGLPEEMQIYHLRSCDKTILRQRVVQAFYRCYPPFQKRLLTPYPLAVLEGTRYIASWYNLLQSKHLMCYKFQRGIPTPVAGTNLYERKIGSSAAVADNWESLADATSNKYSLKEKPSSLNNMEGLFILLIYSKRFPPLTFNVIFNHDNSPLRFVAGRVLLSSDMKSENLEFDFVSNVNEKIVTVKHLEVCEYKVLPWWHPIFEKFLSCEQIDCTAQ